MELLSSINNSGIGAQYAVSAAKDVNGNEITSTYLTAVPEGYATESFVTSQGYITGSYLTADALDNVSSTWNTVTNKLDSTAFSTVSGNFLTAHQSLPSSANWNATYNTVNGNSATWNSTYDTVHDNSASWTGAGASVTSPRGTINVNGDEIEGTNSAVLTGTAGGYTNYWQAYNDAIQPTPSVLTYESLPYNAQTGGTLVIPVQGVDTSLYITITGETFGGSTASASGQGSPYLNTIDIPLGEMCGPFTAQATYWVNLGSNVLTASAAPTTGITGVGELAWNSALDSIRNTSAAWNSTYSTVATNSAFWGGGSTYTGDAQGALDEVYSKSGDWNTVTDKLNTTAFSTVSGDFLTAHQSLANSGNWDSTYTAVSNNSATWATVTDKLDSTAFSTVSGNFLTAHQALPNSGNWDSTYTTVSTNSATWATVTDKLNSTAFSTVSGDFLTAHQALPNSANWDSTYTTVNTNSADWNSAAAMNELPVSAGQGMDIQNVDGNIVFSCTGGSVPEGVLVESGLEYDNIEISGYSGSAFKDVALSETVATNSGAWGGSALSLSAGNGISLSMVDGVLVISVTGGN